MKKTILVLTMIALLSGCDDSTDSSDDSSGGGGGGTVSGPLTLGSSLSYTSATPTSFTANWGAASDTTTASSNLDYTLYYSTSNNISTAATAASNGTVGMSSTAATTSKALSGLTAATTYYVTVVVTDPSANTAVYTSSETTPAICAPSGNGYPLTNASGGGVSSVSSPYLTGTSGTISSVTLYLESASTNLGLSNLYSTDDMTLTVYSGTFGGSVLGTSTITTQLGPSATAEVFNFTPFSVSGTVVLELTLNSAQQITNASNDSTMYVIGGVQSSGHFCTFDISLTAGSGAPSLESGTWQFAGFATP